MTLAAGLMLAATPAWSQIGSLPQELIRKTGVLTETETTQVTQYIQPLLAGLASENADERARSRASLIEPLRTAGVSVAFQQAYSSQVSGPLGPLVGSDIVPVKIAAIETAGWLGTVDGWQLVSGHLSAEQPGVRLAAGVAARSILEAAGTRSPAINASAVGQVVEAVAEQLATEPDPFVADGLARTLMQGGQLVAVSGYEQPGRQAWAALADHLATRAFNSKDQNNFEAQQTRLTMLGALEFFRTTGGLARPVGGVDPAITKAAASLSGEALSMVAAEAQASNGRLSDEMVRIGRMAYTVLSLAARQASQTPPEGTLANPPSQGADPGLYFRDARTYGLSLTQKYQLPGERIRRWFD